MLRLLFFMNTMGSIYFLLHAFLLPFRKKYLPPGYRVFLFRINLLLFIIPFPAIFYYLRRYFNNIALKTPLDPFRYNGSHITLHFMNETCFMLPKPRLIEIMGIFIWITVCILLVVRNLFHEKRLHHFHSFFSLFLNVEKESVSAEADHLVQAAMKELNMKKKPRIYVVETIIVPHVSGIFRPKLYLPAHWDVPKQVYYMMIKHELAHILHKDLLVRRISLILSVIFWCNPALYFLLPRLAGYDELYADACACDGASREDRKAYGMSILDLMGTSSGIPNIPAKGLGLDLESMKFMEERIYNMKKNNLCKHKPLKIAATAIMSAFIFTLFAVPAMAYSMPAALAFNDQSVELNSVDMYDIDTLSSENTLESLTNSAQLSENELYDLINNLDFSKSDTYCIDENGMVYEMISPYFSGCNHIWVNARVSHHDKISGGRCTVSVYKARRCSECGDTVVESLYAVTTFEKCPH